jgi:hypothetical protein
MDVTRRPAHAGPLRASDRVIFALVFAVMVLLVVVVTVSAAQARNLAGERDSRATAASVSAPEAMQGIATKGRQAGRTSISDLTRRARKSLLDKRLVAALRPVIAISQARLAVGIIDETTRLAAFYHGDRHIWAASPADPWRLTSTTVADQLGWLVDLTAAGSPSRSAARSHELSLLARLAASQRWGVSAAASPATISTVSNGARADRGRWDVDSVGVIQRAGQELLVAVLSAGDPSRAAGIALTDAAAIAAANMITRIRP